MPDFAAIKRQPADKVWLKSLRYGDAVAVVRFGDDPSVFIERRASARSTCILLTGQKFSVATGWELGGPCGGGSAPRRRIVPVTQELLAYIAATQERRDAVNYVRGFGLFWEHATDHELAIVSHVIQQIKERTCQQ